MKARFPNRIQRFFGWMPILVPAVAWAAEEGTEPSLGWTALRLMLALGIVIASIYITLNYGLRRLMNQRGISGGRSMITILERVHLEPKKTLFVIQAGSEYLLLGGGEGSLTLLAKLDPEEVQRLQKEAPPDQTPFLQKLLSRRGPRPPPSA
jgi:flagellar protein FliO/FliZ